VTLEKFVSESKLDTLQELEKALLLAFFYLRKENLAEFSASGCASWMNDLHLGKPNVTRLEDKLKRSPRTVSGAKRGLFRLHHTYLKELDSIYPQFAQKSQEVMDDGTILPPAVYEKTYGYIFTLAKEINSSYEHNIFDGCSVLMRRLEEVLLILSYQKLGIDGAIRDANGNYFLLEAIVKDAVGNLKLDLSRNSKTTVEEIRKLGNYSAHKITYICRREYIKEKIDDYRALIDELLNKSGART
jgi:hypothetical protein